MKDLYDVEGVERIALFGSMGDHDMGAFRMWSREGLELHVIAASGMGWEHVSVSTQRRTPTWEEMELVKRAFFYDNETVMQLHVPPADHINQHPHCLHLWRPHADVGEIPRPPAILVGANPA